MKIADWKEALNATVWISALGYFVDMFDISLFGVVRVASLKDLGLTDPTEILNAGVKIYNAGMIGMMLGGLIWGIAADRIGRISVLFGSILIYSLGNIANAFVWDVNSYAAIRFITGIGLAGELGAAITLVAESLPTKYRGIGTTVVATLGLLGSIAAAFVGQILPWQTSYILGGVMGLALMAARFKLMESGMFHKTAKEEGIVRGSLPMLLKKGRWKRYLACILTGAPIYFMTGILFTFSPEITAALGIVGVTAGNAILYGSIGLAIGDLLSGLLSQVLASRKRAVAICMSIALAGSAAYILTGGGTPAKIYAYCFLLGLAGGYWAVLITMAAEQFGTNLRGTVTTTVPNFVRGSGVLSVTCFAWAKTWLSIPNAALFVGAIVFTLAAIALYSLRETFSQDLDFNET